jgi:prophage tail gpP-like protein
MNAVFAKTTAGESDTIKAYLQKLASQKNIIMTHNEKGQLVFTEAKAKQKAVFHFEKNMPGTSMSLSYNGQAMHSHITVVKQASSKGGNAGESTIRNPFVPFVYRPKVMTQTSGDDIDTAQAAKNALAEELKNIAVTIVTDRWKIGDSIIKPNHIVTIQNPDIYLYEKTEWFIESVDFSGDAQKKTATIKLVLPEVYNGRTPKYIFQGINLH